MSENTILVKVSDGLAGSKAVELPEGATVAEAAGAAGYLVDGKDITVNASKAKADTVLSDGDRVALTKGAKNNA